MTPETHILSADTEQLHCILTDEEYRDRAQQLAEAHLAVEAEEARAATIKSGLKSAMEILTDARHAIAKVVNERKERRPVDVRTEADFKRNVAIVRRLDTFEAVRERPLSPAERQLEFGPTIDAPPVDERPLRLAGK